MQSKVNMAAVIICIVVAFNVGAVSSASAAGSWFVNGTKLATGATIAVANTTQVDESTFVNGPSLGIKLTCSGAMARENKAYIQGNSNFGVEGVILTGCSEISPTNCTIQREIETAPLIALFETGAAPLDRVRLAAKTGKVLTVITFRGTCVEAGEQPFNGQFVMDSRTGQTESTTAPLEGLGTTENNSLEIFGSKVYIVGGKTLTKLVSGLTWSFH